MKKRKIKVGDVLFVIFVALLIIPQTRTPIQVAINSVKVQLFTPSALDMEDRTQLEPFTYRLTSLKGTPSPVEIGRGEVTFLSYWATWCPPCIAELPSIQKLYADYGDKINFVLITNENPKIIQEFLEEKQYDIPVVLPQMETPKVLSERSIPTNYIIDKAGQIIVKEQGAADWNSEKVRGILDKLIGGEF
ncbi:redoxin family protein [Maribacter sp. 2304DJ31-5]|uniref:redoxin family protein n=1 Tax=Maribacter sp. 2304DJ31-5 TaxID=3386273 RepID=UPI0039BC8FD6